MLLALEEMVCGHSELTLKASISSPDYFGTEFVKVFDVVNMQF